MDVVVYLLIFQGFMGGFDVMWNHEFVERLPSRTLAALEQKIHGARELFYAVIFIGLAWSSWNGLFALLFGIIIFIEVLLTFWDFIVEDKTRVLTPTERITHTILSISGGAYIALLIPYLIQWSSLNTNLSFTEYGYSSLVLTIFGVGVFLWGIRDLRSGFQLGQSNQQS